MSEQLRTQEIQDPSANVLLLVGNAVAYIEKMLVLNQHLYEQKLEMAVESSRRERIAETDRVNKLRAEDVVAISVANDRAIKQAELLNERMMDSAEVLRKSMEATAITIANQFDKMTSQQNERIAALERVNSENIGKAISTPNWQEIVTQLQESNNKRQGREGLSTPMLMMISGAIVGVIVYVLEKLFQ